MARLEATERIGYTCKVWHPLDSPWHWWTFCPGGVEYRGYARSKHRAEKAAERAARAHHQDRLRERENAATKTPKIWTPWW